MTNNYEYIGNLSSKKIIIFLHEGLGSVAQWKKFPTELCEATNSCGLVYDRAGYGKSKGDLTKRKTDYLHLAAEELFDIIEKELNKTFDIYLYGHSDGGSIALIFAAKYPNKIKAIITEAAHVFVEQETITGVKKARDRFKEGLFTGLQKYHGSRWEEVFFAWNDIWLDPKFKNWNITNSLNHIRCKQLVIQGREDQFATLKQVYTIEEHTPGETQIFLPKNCGHAPHKEATDNVIHTTTLFINAN